MHAFLEQILVESEPPVGTGAHLRWELDRAFEQLRKGREDVELAQARKELADLAAGPGAALLAEAIQSTGGRTTRQIRSVLTSRAREQIWKEIAIFGPPSWVWPRWSEVAAALTCAALVGGLSSHLDLLTQDSSTQGLEVYKLSLDEEAKPPVLRLERRTSALTGIAATPDQVELMTASSESNAGIAVTELVLRDGRAVIHLDRLEGPAWYWARSPRPDGLVELSNLVWVAGQQRETVYPSAFDLQLMRRIQEKISRLKISLDRDPRDNFADSTARISQNIRYLVVRMKNQNEVENRISSSSAGSGEPRSSSKAEIQARYLMLTARKSGLEVTGQVINEARMRLANILSAIYQLTMNVEPGSRLAARGYYMITNLQLVDHDLELQSRLTDTLYSGVEAELSAVNRLMLKFQLMP